MRNDYPTTNSIRRPGHCNTGNWYIGGDPFQGSFSGSMDDF
jgi:hypothetical protein